MQAEQPEQPGRRFAQGLVRASEHRPDVGGPVVAGDRVQCAAGGAQPGGDRGQGYLRLGRGLRGGHGQGQRQPGTQLDQGVDRVRLGGDPVGTEPGGQQLPGLARREQVQRDRLGAVDRDQAGEPVAAGDHGEAAGAAGQ